MTGQFDIRRRVLGAWGAVLSRAGREGQLDELRTGEMAAMLEQVAGELSSISPEEVAATIDHTLLKPDGRQDDILLLCREAREYGFASVCVHPCWVRLCAGELRESPVAVCTVVGFPLGATLPAVKAYEAGRCIAEGAGEIDMVINIGALKSGDHGLVESDIAGVVEASRGVPVKVIIETAYLDRREKEIACVLARSAGAAYVKTSTGFGPAGASVEDVWQMRQVVGEEMGVKAAGGVRTADDLRRMLAAGASRIGASAGASIIKGIMDQA